MISDQHQTKYLNIDGHSIPVWIYGDERNPLIYFIHGYFRGFSDYIGDLPMRYLMKRYCVLAFDLPGFGYLKEMEKDRVTFIAQIIEQTSNGRRFVLFGASYGGLLAIKYGVQYPEKVKGIIIAGMPYYFGIRKVVGFVRRVPIINKQNISKILEEFGFLNKNNLAKLKAPVLLLYSSSDRQATPKMTKALQKIIPNSQLFITKGLNHGWLLHRIDESGFLDEIENFIKSLK